MDEIYKAVADADPLGMVEAPCVLTGYVRSLARLSQCPRVPTPGRGTKGQWDKLVIE